MKVLYDESSLKDQVETLRAENEELKRKQDEYQNRITQIEGELTREKEESSKYKNDTDNSYQKYADDIIQYEQDIENLKDEVNKHLQEIKAKTEKLNEVEKNQTDFEEKIRTLEARLSEEIRQKEDIDQKYQVLVDGMKDFESSISEMSQENQVLQSQIEKLKSGINEEKGRVKGLEDSITVSLKDGLIVKLNKLGTLCRGFDFEQLINPRLVQDNERVNIDSFNSALEDCLAMFVEKTNQIFTSEVEEKRYCILFWKTLMNLEIKKRKNMRIYLRMLLRYKVSLKTLRREKKKLS